MVDEGIRWHYDVLDGFFQQYYKDLITENMGVGDEIHVKEFKCSNGLEIEVEEFYYPFRKDKKIYLIPSAFVNKLPLNIMKEQKVSYKGKGYIIPKLNENDGTYAIKPMKIRPEKRMSFRELVNVFANTKHDNPDDEWLWRLISIVALLDRINVRVATPPEFGKDSKINLLSSLSGKVGMISNPTVAKLEYLLFNKLIFLNEVSGIKSSSKEDVEQFILSCADFSNKYVKRSRASAGANEEYDISTTSLVVAYNDISQYTTKGQDKYFDFLWNNAGAINNRVIPFLFRGKQKTNFNKNFNVNSAIKDNWDFYLNFIRTLFWYWKNPTADDKDWNHNLTLDFKSNGRWERNFNKIIYWLKKTCDNQQEYINKVQLLYKRHLDYLRMLGKEELEIEEVKLKQTIEQYITQNDKCDGVYIKDLKDELGVSEKQIRQKIMMGDIYENKTGMVKLL